MQLSESKKPILVTLQSIREEVINQHMNRMMQSFLKRYRAWLLLTLLCLGFVMMPSIVHNPQDFCWTHVDTNARYIVSLITVLLICIIMVYTDYRSNVIGKELKKHILDFNLHITEEKIDALITEYISKQTKEILFSEKKESYEHAKNTLDVYARINEEIYTLKQLTK